MYNEEENPIENDDQELTNSSSNQTLNEEPDSMEPDFSDATENPNSGSELKKLMDHFFPFTKNIKIIFFVLIGLVIIIMLIALVIMDYDLAGTRFHPQYVKQYDFKCSSIYLTREKESYIEEKKEKGEYTPVTNPEQVDLSDEERYEYEEIDLNSFIAGIAWKENNDAQDVNNELVYQALAIITRSKIVVTMSSNCVVLEDYNPYNYHKLKGDEEKYYEIINAVNNSQGLIITKDDKPFDPKFDKFTYVRKREQSEAAGRYFIYYMRYINQENYQQQIPADWVKENVPLLLRNWEPLTAKLEYFSLYGAKYLAEKEGIDYTVYRLLEYYYGKDIGYLTISGLSVLNPSQLGFVGSTSGCMWWPVGSTATTSENGVQFAAGSPSATHITSTFGWRNAPTAGASDNHPAIDIGGGGVRHNIIAAASGTVIQVNTGCTEGNATCGGRLGNYVKIQHEDGTITRYGHLYSVNVSNGQTVAQGQVIGIMGTTGTSTGIHLDFQILVNGSPVNPLNYVSASNPRNNCSASLGGGGSIEIGGNNQQTICLSLKSNGFTPNMIGGVMANIKSESNFNPTAINKSSGASGICQWLGGRKKNLQSTYGANWTKLENQIEFLFFELNGSESSTLKVLNNNSNNSPEDLTDKFCYYFERPGVNAEEKRKVCNARASNYGTAANQLANYAKNNCS